MELTKPKISEENMVVNLTPLGLGPWSFSKLKCLKKCPFQFYLKYVLKVKPAITVEVTLDTLVGKAAHRIIEVLLASKGKTLKEVYDYVRKEYPSFSDEEWEEHLVGVEYNITRFKERLDEFAATTPVKRFLQELRIGVTKEYTPTTFFGDDVWFRGIIDLAVQLANGDVIFIDHKYGVPIEAGIRNNKEQLDTYKVLYHYGIEKISGSQSGVHFIKAGDMLLGEYSSRSEIENSLRPRLEHSLNCAVDNLKEIGYFKHIAGNQCKWCEFNEPCKAKEFITMEKETKKWFKIKEITNV